MRNLRSLDITGNKIRALPLELGLCQDLREFFYEEQMLIMPTKEVQYRSCIGSFLISTNQRVRLRLVTCKPVMARCMCICSLNEYHILLIANRF